MAPSEGLVDANVFIPMFLVDFIFWIPIPND